MAHSNLVRMLLRKFCTTVAITLPTIAAHSSAFVTYEFSGGRFGDNLLAYIHAKWLSYAYNITLLYQPFPYSDQLKLHDIETPYDKSQLRKFQRIKVGHLDHLKYSYADIVYVCPYFPESSWERLHLKSAGGSSWCYFPVDWSDLQFRLLLQTLIAPKAELPAMQMSDSKINIALHIREGGGYDSANLGQYYPTKAPPIDFYIQGLQKITDLFPCKSFYCFIFTDARFPKAIITSLQSAFPQNIDISFDCRENDNRHDQNVLNDFFAMLKFDVLIHPESNFSMIPALIHDYAVTYSPKSAIFTGQKVVISESELKINKQKLYELIR